MINDFIMIQKKNNWREIVGHESIKQQTSSGAEKISE